MKNIIKKYLFKRVLSPRELFRDYPYRRYMDHHRCIFIHIPKAAGTSVLKVLAKKRIPRDHCSYNIYRQASRRKFERYYKFCFVRDPYTRLVSVFHYLKNGGNGKADLKFQNLILEKYPTFDRFVLDYLDKDIIHQNLLLKPQYSFVCDYKFDLVVDFCGKFESIDKDFLVVCERLGIERELPKSNTTNYENKNNNINNLEQDVIKKINYLYGRDFSVFNYQTL